MVISARKLRTDKISNGVQHTQDQSLRCNSLTAGTGICYHDLHMSVAMMIKDMYTTGLS